MQSLPRSATIRYPGFNRAIAEVLTLHQTWLAAEPTVILAITNGGIAPNADAVAWTARTMVRSLHWILAMLPIPPLANMVSFVL